MIFYPCLFFGRSNNVLQRLIRLIYLKLFSFYLCFLSQDANRNVLPVGQYSSPQMKFNLQTKPLTIFLLLLTICHTAQTHTFHLVVPMAVPTS